MAHHLVRRAHLGRVMMVHRTDYTLGGYYSEGDGRHNQGCAHRADSGVTQLGGLALGHFEMATKAAVALGVLVFIAACQQPGSQPTCNTMIDWVNFIEVGSTQFVAGPQSPTPIQESDLGPVVAHVKFKVSGNVCDPNYKLKDGDAAFLDPGTAIYQVNGHAAGEELAARFNGQIVAYKAL